MNRLRKKYEFHEIDKKIIILSISYIDNSRYMKTRKQNALALIKDLEKSTFFLIFICNLDWFEFERDLSASVSIENRSNLIARVFQLKLKKLLRDLIERHMLEKIKTHTYVIEFQKRNLFHAYILIIAHLDDDITQNNIDDVVQIIISNREEDSMLYELITKHIIHKNCQDKKNVVCHDKKERCTKLFSKSQSNISDINHLFDYSQYRRSQREKILEIIWDNIWIVLYNVYLLKKYETYLNVKVCTFTKSVRYLY